MKVEEVMQSQVICCRNDHSLQQAAQAMWDADIGCLPVVDDENKPVALHAH